MSAEPVSEARNLFERGVSGELEDIWSRGRTSVFAGDAVVLKVFLEDTDKPDREIAGLETAATTGLRVPELLWHGEIDGRRAVLLERLAGTQPVPTTDDEWRSLSEATGAVARHLHVPVPAFGAWTVTPHDSVAHLIAQRATDNAAVVRSQGVVDPEFIDRCHRWVLQQAERLDAAQPVFVHRDLSDRNVFGTRNSIGWELSAVIDFESSGGGLPEEEARWPALLELGGIRPPGSLHAYRSGLRRELNREALDVHVVDLAIDVMSYAGHRNPALMDAALAAARATVR